MVQRKNNGAPKIKVTWNEEAFKSFRELLQILCSDLKLGLSDFTKEMIIQQTLVNSLGAKLLVMTVENFHLYLYGRKFIIYTDHLPLTWIWSKKILI